VVEPWINHGGEAGKGINNRQNAHFATSRQLVMNEIHCPDLVGMGCVLPVFSELRLHTALGHLVAELQAHLLVKAIDPLRVDRPSIPPEQDMDTPVAIANPRLADVLD